MHLLRALCMLLVAVLAATAAAQPLAPALTGTHTEPVPLQPHAQLWLDPSGQALVDNVATDAQLAWQPLPPQGVVALRSGQALWIRFTLQPALLADRWYLEVPYPAVDKVTLYASDESGQRIPQTAGDTVAVAQWPLPHRYPFLPVAAARDAPRTLYLKVENAHSFGAPLSLVSESYLSAREQRAALVLGMYFGLAGLAMTLALVGALWLRDLAYGAYALAALVMSLAQASLTGVAGLHLWPHAPWWNDASALALPVLAVAATVLFYGVAVSLGERSRPLWWALQALAASGVAVAVGALLVAPSLRYLMVVPYIAVGAAAGLALLAWAARRGDPYGLWMLVAATPLIASAAFPLARVSGLMPVSFWTTYGTQVGIALELPLLLMILVLRSQERRENQRRLRGLYRIDPATGLLNAQAFEERLARMVARARRLRHQGAVLVLEVVNMDALKRDFGRGADEVPLQVAGRVLSAAREIDTVARLGELRFGLLVEGPLSAEESGSLGPRLVARCLMPYTGKPEQFVPQVRIAQTLVPWAELSAQEVVAKLAQLLATVPGTSKRAVFQVGPRQVLDPHEAEGADTPRP